MQNENFTNETFTIVDTKALQVKSLLDFAEALGYVPVDKSCLSKGFRLSYITTTYYTSYISLKDMVKLHNGFLHRVIYLTNGYKVYDFLELKHLIVSDHLLTTAQDFKLVQQVKLQRDKKEPDGVKCQNHMVKLTPRGEELYSHLRSL